MVHARIHVLILDRGAKTTGFAAAPLKSLPKRFRATLSTQAVLAWHCLIMLNGNNKLKLKDWVLGQLLQGKMTQTLPEVTLKEHL